MRPEVPSRGDRPSRYFGIGTVWLECSLASIDLPAGPSFRHRLTPLPRPAG
ncbi:hypothetical protein ACSMX9_26680 [Streptomyces sp. LE64]|uniref:hypothetical protein n=1 Tax=Streptomyces sp. LE64 TaxID=3448653 RepID=UPI004041DF6B